MLSIVVAAVPAFQPHPIGNNYYLCGDETQVVMNGLQLREKAIKIFRHHDHLP
jgi:hypothetical protein